jgi:prepilin signal peptidase PulO-like enzyme (type II secretory pathway)
MLFFIFISGLCIGSFLNALIYRLYQEEKISVGRSYCPKCKKQLKKRDLVPVLSFIFLTGKCRYCKQPISWQYPLVELLVGFLFLFTYLKVDSFINIAGTAGVVTLFLYLFFISVLVLVFVFDFKYYLILDKVTIPAGIIILLGNILINVETGLKPVSTNLFFGVLIGGGFFYLQYIIPPFGRKIFKNKIAIFKQDWIGGGDVKLGIVMGLMFGWKMTLLALMISYLLGSVVGIMLLVLKKKELGSKLPFGTFLSASSVVVLLWGEEIWKWYVGLF